MYLRDRVATLALLAGAVASWAAVGWLFLTVSPVANVPAQLAGAGLIAAAAALTVTPLAWLVGFARQRRIAYRGDWSRAARRGLWVGLVLALFIILRTQGAFSLPIAAFIVVMVLFLEVTLTVRR